VIATLEKRPSTFERRNILEHEREGSFQPLKRDDETDTKEMQVAERRFKALIRRKVGGGDGLLTNMEVSNKQRMEDKKGFIEYLGKRGTGKAVGGEGGVLGESEEMQDLPGDSRLAFGKGGGVFFDTSEREGGGNRFL